MKNYDVYVLRFALKDCARRGQSSLLELPRRRQSSVKLYFCRVV